MKGSIENYFRDSGADYGSVHNIVDIPYFAGRIDTRMLQLADIVAYAVFQYYEHNDPQYIELIKDRFDKRGPNEPPDGLKHITNDSCDCYACAWRQEKRNSK